jgi:HPt (histidine-containing phosphotransfer) domain-containing protein
MAVFVEDIKAHLERQFNFSPEQIEMMLPSFIETLAMHMKNLENALLAENRLIALGKTGHTLKGALLNLGMEECAQLAFQIEKNGKQGNADVDYHGLIAAIREKMGHLIST